MVSCLQGKDVATPNLEQLRAVALTLAKMHLAGKDFKQQSLNQRGQDWFEQTAKQVLPQLNLQEQTLLQSELTYQQALDTSLLPHGVIHGDLFRDNVLFDNDTLGGFIDFYYACNDVLAYDLAIAVNEWCLHHNGPDLGNIDHAKVDAFLSAYQSVRPLTAAENSSWHALLRRAALRFWLSRLHDFHFPQVGEITHAKDPNHFKSILQARIALKN
jgi:homoserine kinase type II